MFKFATSPDFMKSFRMGDRFALESIYWAYLDEVEAIVRSSLNSRRRLRGEATPVPDVGDMVQEIFARAFSAKARESYDGSRDYGPYIGALARNLTIDWLRRNCHEMLSEDPELLVSTSDHDAESASVDAESLALVERYVSGLPSDLRQVYEHRYVACRSQREVCPLLGISRQELRTKEKRLRDGLRRAWEERTEPRSSSTSIRTAAPLCAGTSVARKG